MSCEVAVAYGTLRVSGEMTIYHAEAMKAGVLGALMGEARVSAIDLSAVSEFDTSGLQVLLVARRLGEDRGTPLKLVNASSAVEETARLLGMGAGFDVAPTAGEA